MNDTYGRKIEYLRISVTDKCNLRCKYCMPPGGVKTIPHEEILRLEEIYRLTNIMAGLGVNKVRLTGGEPTVRKNITELVRSIGSIPQIHTIAMTTNGVRLPNLLPELVESGLTNLNISIDTLNPDKYREITGFDRFHDVMTGIDMAYEAGIKIKLNCVPCRGFNDKDLIQLAEIACKKDIDVRFIELMPIGRGRLFTGIPSKEILDSLEQHFGKSSKIANIGEGPAEYYVFNGFKGRVGFISPISHKFCAQCNRLRLTSEGRLKLCLYYKDGVDLRELLRNGASDIEIQNVIKKAIMKKPKEHFFGEQNTDNTEIKRMNQIGG